MMFYRLSTYTPEQLSYLNYHLMSILIDMQRGISALRLSAGVYPETELPFTVVYA